ncbi:hypothetical protein [Glaciecola petra]|uniref:Uncharacterized protein n=1 Tax=Glaciecola petra TaxID=3075602 RepID=A0ABU2ZPB4_9ALTE|nr:hypothetical protein [Aestuariibacter sp. P117]MDT0594261.1 hypothetical protein [Aestuariibacter sp. P117]
MNAIKPTFSGFNPDYKFDIKNIFEQGNALTKQNIFLLARALVMIISLGVVVILILFDAYGISDIAKIASGEIVLTIAQQLGIDLSLTVVLAPLWTGISMAAVFSNRSINIPFSSIFVFFKLLPLVAIAYLLINTSFEIGLRLLVIPGFYIFVATTFTLILIADKGLRPFQAIWWSVKAVNHYIVPMLVIFSCFFLMLILVFFTFGLAYLYVGPLFFNVKAILYEAIFCHESILEERNVKSEQGVFDA